MKPAPLAYAAPTSLDEAVAVLGELGHEAKVIAGGQSLIPLLNMRLAEPRYLVDITRIPTLRTLACSVEGVRVGAAVRQRQVELDPEIEAALPLLRQALVQVAHPVVRNRGTVVGSLAHADPSAELTAALVLAEGSVDIVGSNGARTVPAAEFFLGAMEPALSPGELVTSAFFPALSPRTATAVMEVARRHGDFALAGIAAAVTVDREGRIETGRVVCLSLADVPMAVDVSSAVMAEVAGSISAKALTDAEQLVDAAIQPEADIHASIEYRRRLARVLSARALVKAAASAARMEGI